MTQNTVWDGTNENIHSNSNEDLAFDHPYELSKNSTKQIKTDYIYKVDTKYIQKRT